MKLDKTQEENVKTLIRMAMRFAEIYNYYGQHFDDNPYKRYSGQTFYEAKVKEILTRVDALSQQEKEFFAGSLAALKDKFEKDEKNKMLTLQFSSAKLCKQHYESIDAIISINEKRKKQILQDNFTPKT